MKRVLLCGVACMLAAMAVTAASAREVPRVGLDIPVRVGPPAETGPTTLAMVLAAYGADSVVLKRTREAYDPVTQTSSIEALEALAKKLGYDARIATPGYDSLLILLGQGIPPILCIEPLAGSLGKQRYMVIANADTRGRRYLAMDGRPFSTLLYAKVIASVWNTRDGRALLVTPRK